MKNLYNKGKFRGFEYGKITPYLKKLGNKKWRKTKSLEIDEQLFEKVKFMKWRRKKQKNIHVKITLKFRETKFSEFKKFSTEKAMRTSVNRPHVLQYFFIENNLKK